MGREIVHRASPRYVSYSYWVSVNPLDTLLRSPISSRSQVNSSTLLTTQGEAERGVRCICSCI